MQNLVGNQIQFSKHQRNAKFLFDQRNFSSYRTSKALRSSDHQQLGLDRTRHMSFLTGQDRTPNFAGQVLRDRTKSGLIFLMILPTKYMLSILIR